MTPADESAIQKIAIFYAHGVDTLGNERNPALALDHLRRGFTEDCAFQYFWPDGASFGNLAGLRAFVDFAQGFMREKDYRNTQHAVSNFLVEPVADGQARMASYVIARHFKRDNSQDIATACYEDEIVRVDGVWKCRLRKCLQLSFDNFAPAYTLR